nr:hypothetical protein [Tanacetum cinerariifolium]
MGSSESQFIFDIGTKSHPTMLVKGRNQDRNPPIEPFVKLQTYANLNVDEKKCFEANIDAMNAILLGIPRGGKTGRRAGRARAPGKTGAGSNGHSWDKWAT